MIDKTMNVRLMVAGMRYSLAMTVLLLVAQVFWPGARMAYADSLNTLESLSQAQFETFSKNLSAATHYKSIAPPENLGTIGFDVGVEVSSTDIDGDLFDLASGGDFDGTELIIPRLHAHKGLPFGLDIGASVTRVPDTEFSILGAELRYALIEGNAVKPALGIRATHSRVEGASDFDLHSSGLELAISKGFLMLTPYAGAGIIRSTADPKGVDNLSEETYEQTKYYLGATLNLGIAFTVEVDRTGDYRTYSAKAGIRF